MEGDDLVAYARAIAPHVDRLAVAVHKHARPAAAALLREFKLAELGILVDARPILLAGPITLDDVAVIDRYVPRDELLAGLEEHVTQGILERDDAADSSTYVTSVRGRDLLLRVTELQGQTITALWAVHQNDLPDLVLAATRVMDHAAAALSIDLYPAFRLQHAAPAPLGASPAHLLLTRLTTLRYLRADAHAQALASAGLSPDLATALTELWRADAGTGPAAGEERGQGGTLDVAGPALESVRARGLAEWTDGRWRISVAGRALRDEIEAETNRNAAPPFVALDSAERAAFLKGLEKLPD